MESKDVIYRPARLDDAAAIVEFQVNMARETEEIALDGTICSAGVQAVFDEPSRGRYFVAEREGQVIGSLLITYEWSDWRCRNVWWIQSVYVREAERGRGVYSGLYRYVRGLAQSDPAIAGIRLYVDRRNERAQQIYARLGMDGQHYQVFEWMKS